MNTYTLGQVVHLTASFAVSGTATDPGTVSLITRDPGGAEITYTYGGVGTIVRDSTGNYHQDVTPDKSGTWGYRWVSTGVCASAAEGSFYLNISPF